MESVDTSAIQQYGLTENESLMYLTLLRFGPSAASTLARRTNLKRVTVYAVLRSLQRSQFIHGFKRNDVTYFEARDPEIFLSVNSKIIEREKQKQTAFRRILPKLRKLVQKDHESLFRFHDRITYFQGISGIRRLLDETLREGKKEQLCFGINRFHIENPKSEWQKYTQQRVKVGMPVRSIVPDTPEARRYKKRDKDELRETRLIPENQYRAACELNIIGNKVAIIDVNPPEEIGALIESKEIAQTLRNLFELAWERAGDLLKPE